MAVIGQADIIIGADASGFPGQVERQTKGPMQKVGSTIASAMGTTLKIGAAAVATGVGAVLGVAISSGMGRLSALDTAEAKMRGLGYSGQETESIMAQVADAVLGTYFSTADMASAASQMLTSGVEPGKELDKVLSGISGTAAATGADIGDITQIWQSMASSGKVSGRELFQLSTRGMNGLKALSDHLGISQEDVKAMVTAGEISFEEFNEAIVASTDDMVEEMSKSYEALKVTAFGWLGMAGEEIVRPFFEGAKVLLPAINNLLEPVPAALEKVMAPVTDNVVATTERIADALNRIDVGDGLDKISDGLSTMSGLLIPLGGIAIGALGPLTANIPILRNLFSGLTGPVGAVIGLFIVMFKESEGLRDAFGSILDTIGTVFESLAPSLALFSELINRVGEAVGDILADAIMMILPIVEDLAEALGPVLEVALSILIDLIGMLEPLFPPIIQIIGVLAEALAGSLINVISALLPIIVQLAEILGPILTVVIEVLVKVLEWLAPILGALAPVILGIVAAFAALVVVMSVNPFAVIAIAIVALIAALKWFFTESEIGQAIVEAVWGAIQAAIQWVVDLWTNTLAPAFVAAWDWILDAVQAVANWFTGTLLPALQSVWDGIVAGVKWLRDAMTSVLDGIVAAWNFMSDGFSLAWETVLRPIWDAVVQTAEQMWGFLSTIFNAIWTVFSAMAGFISAVVSNVLLLAWDLVAFAAKWLWNSVLKPVFGWIGETWQKILAGMKVVWDNVLKPAWDAVASAARWLWDSVLKPVFQWIRDYWDQTLRNIKAIWENILRPVWDSVKSKANWLWDALKAIFRWISDYWSTTISNIKKIWVNVLKPAWDAVRGAASDLWNKLKGFFTSIGDKWGSLIQGIKNLWNNTLKPIWTTISTFVSDTLVNGIERGIDKIDRAWRRVANIFREPINFVINKVWNNGLKAAFDNVSKAVGSTARLPSAPNIPRFAQGGRMESGWKLVGEEGPELIRSGPGWVHTADETKRLLADPMKNPLQNFSESDPPHGGRLKDFFGDVADGFKTVSGKVVDAAGAAVEWVQGGLGELADMVLSPIFNGLSGTMSKWGDTGKVGGDAMVNVKDKLVDWIKGKDDEAPAFTGMDTKGRNLRGAKPHVNAAAFAIADAIQPGMFMQAFNRSMKGAHGAGLAVDFMAQHSNLQKTANYMVQHHRRLNGLWEVIYNHRMWTKGNGWRALRGGMGNDPGHVWHVHGGWRAAAGRAGSSGLRGAKRFDQGGIFNHGTMGMNLSGKPEGVLTNLQMRDFQTLVANLRKGSMRMSVPARPDPMSQQYAMQGGSGSDDWSREQMDYLADKIAANLWPMARASDAVRDFASMGRTRQRMGKV